MYLIIILLIKKVINKLNTDFFQSIIRFYKFFEDMCDINLEWESTFLSKSSKYLFIR